jgi:hypothetical protein
LEGGPRRGGEMVMREEEENHRLVLSLPRLRRKQKPQIYEDNVVLLQILILMG